MSYKEVQGTRGPRKNFAVTCGLRVGYGADAQTHSVETAIEAVLGWMKGRAAAEKTFLTGTVTSGEVVYAWPESPGKAGGGREPNIIFSGEVSPLYNETIIEDHDSVMDILYDLATALGSALSQTRIYVAYCDEVVVVQKEEAVTPTGETV